MSFPSDLFQAARDAAGRAYAPYSGYSVGAAIRDRQGTIYTGSNVENLSYGLTICGERSAVAAMAGAGSRTIVEVAVVTRDGGTPCGMCLQTLLEFAPDPTSVAVYTCTPEGEGKTYMLSELIPHGFRSDAVSRTQ